MLSARTRRRRQWHRKRRGVKTTEKSANRIKDQASLNAVRKKNKK